MSDAPKPSLLEQLNARFAAMRALDVTVRRYERVIEVQRAKILECRQHIRIAENAINSQERYLKKRAAEQIREEAGVKVIPGFTTAKEGLKEFRAKMRAKEMEARAEVRAQLQQTERASV